jgi:hypothetical protein
VDREERAAHFFTPPRVLALPRTHSTERTPVDALRKPRADVCVLEHTHAARPLTPSGGEDVFLGFKPPLPLTLRHPPPHIHRTLPTPSFPYLSLSASEAEEELAGARARSRWRLPPLHCRFLLPLCTIAPPSFQNTPLTRFPGLLPAEAPPPSSTSRRTSSSPELHRGTVAAAAATPARLQARVTAPTTRHRPTSPLGELSPSSIFPCRGERERERRGRRRVWTVDLQIDGSL